MLPVEGTRVALCIVGVPDDAAVDCSTGSSSKSSLLVDVSCVVTIILEVVVISIA
jgi:hypothetical protein